MMTVAVKLVQLVVPNVVDVLLQAQIVLNVQLELIEGVFLIVHALMDITMMAQRVRLAIIMFALPVVKLEEIVLNFVMLAALLVIQQESVYLVRMESI